MRPRLRLAAVAAVAAGLLAAPFCAGGRRVGAPRVVTGDEPHYLVMINSLLHDGDLDLGDEYGNAAGGGLDAGASFASAPLDHHTTWLAPGGWTRWSPWCGALDAERCARGDRAPASTGGEPAPPGAVERPTHPPGLALVRAALLWPLRGTTRVEAAALLVSAVFALAAFLLFLRLAEAVAPGPRAALAAAVLAFLGTPVWRYGRSLYGEIDLLLCAVAAYLSALVSRRFVLAGAFLAVGAQIKPPFLLLAIPLVVLALRERRWRDAVALAIPCAVGAAAVLVTNRLLYGSPWHSPQSFAVGNPLAGAAGLLLDLDHGLLWTAPAIVVAAPGWPRFLRSRPREARAIGAAALLYFGLMALWAVWDGGTCYGPRLILPVVPFAMLGAAFCEPAGALGRRAVLAVGALSIAINLAAATAYSTVPTNVFVYTAALLRR